MADEKHVHALHAILEVAARHANLIHEDAFAELTATMTKLVAFDRMSILVPEAHLSLRVYAQSHAELETIPFGARIQGVESTWRAIFDHGLPHFSDDMAKGDDVERLASKSGVRSYGAFPIRDRSRGGVALLVLSYLEPGAARTIPVGLVQAIADALGPAIARSLSLARERRLAMILETSGDALLAWDREGKVTDANGAAERITGRSRAELIGTPIASLLDPPPSPDDAKAEGARLSLLADGGTKRIPVAATLTAVPGDALVAAHALLRDLSEVVRAETEAAARVARIHELEEQHRTLLDNVPLIIFRLDPSSGELVYLNRHAERLLGVPTAEALRTPGFLRTAHADPQGREAFDAAVGRARQGAISLPYEAHLARRIGGEITARGTVYPLLADGGDVAAIEGVLADVSAEHAARARLVQADRLSTLGMLASGMAHEINNPAAFIVLGLDMLARTLSSPAITMDPSLADGTSETLRELRASIRRIIDIARDLRVFASPAGSEGGRTIIDVNRTVESALSLTRGRILERAQIERKLEDVPSVVLDDGRLGQVIAQLLVNATHAIPKSYASEHYVTVATRSDGWTVEIEVSHTGNVIPKEHLHRVWQPFFEADGQEVGVGLSLAISREIVERAGGSITVDSPVPDAQPPRGTRFVISLPVSGQSETTGPRSAPQPGDTLARARVLIVEDEVALARALAEIIGRHHDVEIASGGELALAHLSARRFDVVLCDIRMPGMSGDALYQKVREIDEAQARAFVFMTGVGFGPDVERLIAASGRPVLEKPFSGDAVLTEIARLLRKRSHHP